MHSLFLTFILLFAPVLASDDGTRFDEMADQLALTPAQRAAVEEVLFKARSSRIDIKAKLEKGEMELKRAIGAPTLDPATVRAAEESVRAATGDLIHNKVEQAMAVRKQLSAEQWAQLQRLWRERDDRDEPDAPDEPDEPSRRSH